ncbi:MAG TPA: sigma-70 family RNA polymerase sigma factor [Opitutaceae bacterium]|nr:sigma-70 family RNA polymerase sigma factor [Opitutaceae bacterium]
MSVSPEFPTSSLATRPSLLRRVRAWDDTASWNEFHRLYRKLIYGLARRSGLAHADAEDVTQEVFKRVAETIHQFESNPERGTFRGWLMNLTRWRIADRFDARPKGECLVRGDRERTATGGTGTLDRVPAPATVEAEWELEWQRHLLDAACERLARRAKPRHFQVFELYVRRRTPVLQVARELGLDPASVYLIGSRLTRQLKAEVTALREQWG